MIEVPFTNPTRHAVHLGGKTIRPGDTRMVDRRLLPIVAAEEPMATVPDGDRLSFMPMPETVAEILAVLPELNNDELDALESLEKGEKRRRGVMDGIFGERMRRADGAA